MSAWTAWLAVFVGGGFGSALRYGLSLLGNRTPQHFPWGTLAANLLACFVLGVLVHLFQKHPAVGSSGDIPWKLLLATGFCGGFSTFSTFALELVAPDRAGLAPWFWAYLTLSLLGGGLAVWLGHWSGRQFF